MNLSFEELIKIFFPDKSPSEAAILATSLEKEAMEYYSDTWTDVLATDLNKISVRLNLLKTVYLYQFNYYEGVDSEIMHSLEDWTAGKIYFVGLNDEENLFYQRIYCWLGFVNFEYQSDIRQVTLLSSRFLPLALSYDLPVVENIKRFFARYCTRILLKGSAELFVSALSNNTTAFGPKELARPIADWIKDYNAFKAEKNENKIEEFYEKFIKISGISDDLKNNLHDIIYLYDYLVTDKIWKEINFSLCEPMTIPVDQRKFDFDEYYFKLLGETKNIKSWLVSAADIVKWLKTRPVETIHKMFAVVKDKVNLEDPEEVDLLSKFSTALLENKIITEELFFYGESDNKFHWNEDYLK